MSAALLAGAFAGVAADGDGGDSAAGEAFVDVAGVVGAAISFAQVVVFLVGRVGHGRGASGPPDRCGVQWAGFRREGGGVRACNAASSITDNRTTNFLLPYPRDWLPYDPGNRNNVWLPISSGHDGISTQSGMAVGSAADLIAAGHVGRVFDTAAVRFSPTLGRFELVA